MTSILRWVRSLPGRVVSDVTRAPAFAHETAAFLCADDDVPDQYHAAGLTARGTRAGTTSDRARRAQRHPDISDRAAAAAIGAGAQGRPRDCGPLHCENRSASGQAAKNGAFGAANIAAQAGDKSFTRIGG